MKKVTTTYLGFDVHKATRRILLRSWQPTRRKSTASFWPSNRVVNNWTAAQQATSTWALQKALRPEAASRV